MSCRPGLLLYYAAAGPLSEIENSAGKFVKRSISNETQSKLGLLVIYSILGSWSMSICLSSIYVQYVVSLICNFSSTLRLVLRT